MKRIFRVLLSRTILIGFLAVLQIAVFVGILMYFSNLGTAVYAFLTIAAVLVAAVVCERDDLNPAYRMMWLLLTVVMPVSGIAFYSLWGKRNFSPHRLRQFSDTEKRGAAVMHKDHTTLDALEAQSPALRRCAHYLQNYAAAPLYAGTQAEYYAMGEAFFPRFLEELEKAQKYIFMEYFIINDESEMWRRTLEVLQRKAAQGVDVRILYDSFGCLVTLPQNYDAQLRRLGIKCYAFNAMHFTIHLSDYKMLNHRDHRKITIIDGETGFSGGLNFSDEYINLTSPHGVWKDTGFMLRGEAVYSLTVMFLKMWDYCTGNVTSFDAYRPLGQYEADGFVQPYGDSPLDGENVSENAYFNIIQSAKKYVYIVTPYLIIDNEMITALSLAAKGGVDVRIITPGIPDKWYVYYVTQSYYAKLLHAGVRIFEYTPGFVHAKMYVSDDRVAVVGSANMDYRSLYLHFENCSIFYGGHMIRDVKQDVDETLTQCHEVTLEDVAKTPFYKRVCQTLFRFFAPMM